MSSSGRAWNKNGILILKLKGTHSEMAAQHGALLKNVISNGALPFLGKKNDELIRHSPVFRKNKFLQKLAISFVHLLQKPMTAQVPLSYKEETKALAKACGISYDCAVQAMLQADTLVLLLRFTMGRYLLNHLGSSFGAPGCTSVVALNELTDGKGLIHARNMDYPSVGTWDPNTTVYYSDPTNGDQRTIGITTAGIHTSGVTGLNESGLTLGAHFHCSRKVSLFGVPINVIGNEILRKAKTLGQAIDIVKNLSRAGSWSLVLSSARENDAVVVEIVHGAMEVRQASDGNGILANTNFFRTESLKKTEVLFNSTAAHDFEERYDRALKLLKQTTKKSCFSLINAAEILADHWDEQLNLLRVQSSTISVVTTVTSLISQLGSGKFYVSNRKESPVCLGDYVEFDLHENFHNFENKILKEHNFLKQCQGKTTIRATPQEESMKYFRQAYMAFHNDFDPRKAFNFLKNALELTPDEGNFWLAAGHMLMRMKDAENALEYFQKAKSCPLKKTLIETTDLFCAHCLDILGRRNEAIEIYKQLLNSPPISPHIFDEVKKRLKKPYSIEKAQDITFDFQYCDCFEYI